MDRRFYGRFLTSLEVQVTSLSNPASSASGRVSDVSISGIRVELSHQLAPGEIVRLDLADSSLFGHVRYSNPPGPPFLSGIEVERVLLGTSDSAQLLQKTLNQEMPGMPGLDPSVSGQYRLRQ